MSFDFYAFEYKGDLGVAVDVARRAAAKGVREGLEEAAKKHIKKIRKSFLKYSTQSRGRARTLIRYRSGDLKKSFEYKVRGRGLNDLKLHMWSWSPYAMVMEQGATFTSRGKGWLRIPTSHVLDSKGKVRPQFERAERTFFLEFKNGGAGILQKHSSGVRILFNLAKEVVIEPRLKFAETWNHDFDADRGHFNSIQRHMDRAIEEATK
jgi:hypothetical protein